MSIPVYIGSCRERLTMLHCPACGNRADGATCLTMGVDAAPPRPKPGSRSICMYCGTWLIYEESIASPCPVRLRVATKAEVAAFRKESPALAKLFDITREAFVKGRPQ